MTTHTCPACHRPFRSARSTDPETSRDAGDSLTRREGPLPRITQNSQRHKLLHAYQLCGELAPISDAEAALIAGVPQRSCWWKRCSELRQAGFIAPDGHRLDADTEAVVRVCRITDAGMVELHRLGRPL